MSSEDVGMFPNVELNQTVLKREDLIRKEGEIVETVNKNYF